MEMALGHEILGAHLPRIGDRRPEGDLAGGPACADGIRLARERPRAGELHAARSRIE